MYRRADYERIHEIVLDVCGVMFTGMALCLDKTFMLGTHSEGKISVTNLETHEATIVDPPPFGEVENIWGCCIFYPRPEGEPQTVFIPTTNGLYQCVVTQQGHFMYCMEAFYEGCNVTDCALIDEDEMLVSLQNKMVILNLDTRSEKIVLEAESGIAYFIDMAKIPQSPGADPYFILHTGKGI